jgi:hypothetical protein
VVCSEYSRFNRKKQQSVTMKVRQFNVRLVPSTFDTTIRLSPLRYTNWEHRTLPSLRLNVMYYHPLSRPLSDDFPFSCIKEIDNVSIVYLSINGDAIRSRLTAEIHYQKDERLHDRPLDKR